MRASPAPVPTEHWVQPGNLPSPPEDNDQQPTCSDGSCHLNVLSWPVPSAAATSSLQENFLKEFPLLPPVLFSSDPRQPSLHPPLGGSRVQSVLPGLPPTGGPPAFLWSSLLPSLYSQNLFSVAFGPLANSPCPLAFNHICALDLPRFHLQPRPKLLPAFDVSSGFLNTSQLHVTAAQFLRDSGVVCHLPAVPHESSFLGTVDAGTGRHGDSTSLSQVPSADRDKVAEMTVICSLRYCVLEKLFFINWFFGGYFFYLLFF